MKKKNQSQEAALQDKGRIKKVFSSRKMKFGAFATLVTAGVLVGVILLNVIFTILGDRFNWKLDFTSDGKFSITQQSKDFVSKLNQDIDVYVLTTEDQVLTQSNQVLKSYAAISGHIKIHYVDLVKNPTFTAQYPDEELQEGDILFHTQLRNKVISLSDLVSQNQYNQNQEIVTDSEAVMTSALMAVTAEKQYAVNVLGGHSEAEGIEDFVSLLESNNYTVTTKNIVTESPDADANYVIIYAPKNDYTEEELKKLDTYLENGGEYGRNLLYFASYDQPELPNLEAFLSEWGIGVGRGVIYESNQQRYISNPYLAVIDYTNKDYAGKLASSSLTMFAANSVPVETLFSEKGSITTTSLLSYSGTARLNQAEDPTTHSIPDSNDKSGPFDVLVMAQKTIAGTGLTTKEPSSVIVCGSPLMISAEFTKSTSFANGDYMIGLLNKVINRDEDLNIAPKTVMVQDLNITEAQRNILSIIFIGVIPAIVFIMGITVWIRRRRR